MGKNWKNNYKKKYGIEYENIKESTLEKTNSEIYYTNLGVNELPVDTYHNAIYMGLITDEDNELCELYRVFKDEVEIYAIVSFEKKKSEYKSSIIQIVNKNDDVIDQMIITHGKKILRAEIVSNKPLSKETDKLIHEIMNDKTKTLNERISIAVEEITAKKKVLV